MITIKKRRKITNPDKWLEIVRHPDWEGMRDISELSRKMTLSDAIKKLEILKKKGITIEKFALLKKCSKGSVMSAIRNNRIKAFKYKSRLIRIPLIPQNLEWRPLTKSEAGKLGVTIREEKRKQNANS